MYMSTGTYNIITDTLIHSYYCILVNKEPAFCHFVFSSKSRLCVGQKELIKKDFKNFPFLKSYFERLLMTGTNESNKRSFPECFLS